MARNSARGAELDSTRAPSRAARAAPMASELSVLQLYRHILRAARNFPSVGPVWLDRQHRAHAERVATGRTHPQRRAPPRSVPTCARELARPQTAAGRQTPR